MNRKLGVHNSIAGGVRLAFGRAAAMGATCMQIFSKNPRGWRASELTPEEIAGFRSEAVATGIAPVFIHCSYLLNIASPEEELRRKSTEALRQEMERADALGAGFVVLHTGTAHDGQGRERAARSIREAFKGGGFHGGLLLENTSGKRGDTTSRIPELAELMELSGGLPAGICLDSCHAFAAGYDLTSEEGMQALAGEIKSRLGKGAVRLLHLNDSKGTLGSGTDRHEHIGEGLIGPGGLRRFANHPLLSGVPIVLETPQKDPGDDSRNLKKTREILGLRG